MTKVPKKHIDAFKAIFGQAIKGAEVSLGHKDYCPHCDGDSEVGFVQFEVNMDRGSAWIESKHLNALKEYTGCQTFVIGRLNDALFEEGVTVIGRGVTKETYAKWGSK